MSNKIQIECFKKDFGIDVFDGSSYEEYFSPKPLTAGKLLARFSSCDTFLPAAVSAAKAAGWASANGAALIYDFRYEIGSREVRRDSPMLYLGAFPYWDLERYENLVERGKYPQALVEINKAIALCPDSEDFTERRGWIHEQLGKYDLAKADYEQAIRLGGGNNPGSESVNNLAWILATAPDAEIRDAARAVELALSACKMSRWKDTSHLGTLAAAYANNGQFEEAISWQEKALARAKAKAAKAELRAGLELYRAGQPYRLPQRRS